MLDVVESQARQTMIERRSMVTGAMTALVGMAFSRNARAQAGMSRITAYAFSFPGLAGGNIRLADYGGRPVPVVHTASLFGFPPPYSGLPELWAEVRPRGLMII